MIADKVHEFARGASFEVIMSLPSNVEADYFIDWRALSQLRKAGKPTEEGYIADLKFKWLDEEGHRKFMLSSNDTDKWPLGAAVFDVLFITRKGDRRIRTKQLQIMITDGVTQN